MPAIEISTCSHSSRLYKPPHPSCYLSQKPQKHNRGQGIPRMVTSTGGWSLWGGQDRNCPDHCPSTRWSVSQSPWVAECVWLLATPQTVAHQAPPSPGKNTGMGCHFLLQGIFPTQGSNPDLLHCRQILYRLSHQRSPPGWWGVSATMAHSNSGAVLLDSRVRKAKTLSLYVWKEYRCPQTCQNQIRSRPSTPSCSWLLHFTTFTFKSFFFFKLELPCHWDFIFTL